MPEKRKWMNSFTVGLLLTVISFFLYRADLPLFHLLELKTFDVMMRARGTRPVSGKVVIVAIDEKSLKEQGRWPWPRALMARLTDRLTDAGAAAIGFDILFPEKETSVPLERLRKSLVQRGNAHFDQKSLMEWLDKAGDSDRQFAAAIERSGRTVLGYFVYGEEARGLARKLDEKQREILDFSQYSVTQRLDDPKNPVSFRCIHGMGMSITPLLDAANSMAYVSFIPEVDGVVRWVPLVMEYQQVLFPPLNLQTLHEATRLPLAVRVAPYGVDQVRVGETRIPVSENGDFLVNYYGPAHTFPYFSATDVLSGKVEAGALQGRIVLVGATAAGTHDIHTSPYGPLYPGTEVHANVIENILQQDFLERPEWFALLDLGMIVASGFILGLLSLYCRAVTTAIVLVCGLAGYVGADFYLFSRQGIWISAYPVFTQAFVYTGITLYRFAFEEREKRFIRGAFSQYLAPAVVAQLVENPSLLKLGGERRELTAFFSDVAGFSTISEKLSAGDLVELLNTYLTEMTEIILKYEGTVDKYEGDAIIAFFGAPIPYEDHARRACLVCIEMQERLTALRDQWRREGRHELFVRMGVNTGPMVIGNMGSSNRMDYTMMGDSVNLAARLEGVNKQYGTYTMISEFTYESARDFIEVRELDLIRVVGKSEPVRIYEVLGRKGEMDGKLRELLPFYKEGLGHYKARQWNRAADSFERALEINVDDGPSLTHFERCILFQAVPPAENWDGVFGMLSK